MARVVEDLECRSRLDDPAGVHHGHAIGDGRDDTEIVGDQDDRHAGRAWTSLSSSVLRLDRHVERRRGLVRDQEPRLAREPIALETRWRIRR